MEDLLKLGEEVLTVVEVLLLTDMDEIVAHVLALFKDIKGGGEGNALDVWLELKMLEKSIAEDSSSEIVGIGDEEGDSLL